MTSDKVGYKPAHAIKERFKDHISGKIFLYCELGMASIFRPNAPNVTLEFGAVKGGGVSATLL